MKQYFIILSIFISSALIIQGCNNHEIDSPTPSSALKNYLSNEDNSFSWEIRETIQADGVTVYQLNLVSQKWREYTWKHNLAILVPAELDNDEALLFISGGRIKDGVPLLRDSDNDQINALAPLAKHNKAIIAILWQVPNQPLYNDLYEDALISYTLHNYLNDRDLTWPLLFPMTKSAIRAMDAVQDFAQTTISNPINGFTVSGFSKRGWTTWLTGATDNRVKSIAPMVIDVLNMPVNVDYQVQAWGDYSVEIQDYVNLGIAQKVGSPDGIELTQMIDPYSYKENLTMPKMIFIGTNDPYWPVDAVKNYFDSIPGENFIHYVPNVGHDLGDKQQALQALSAFWQNTMEGLNYPTCKWTVTEEENTLNLEIEATKENLVDLKLWTSISEDRDFRDNEFFASILNIGENSTITIDVSFPEVGFKAFYVDFIYSTTDDNTFSQSTRMFVLNNEGLTEKHK